MPDEGVSGPEPCVVARALSVESSVLVYSFASGKLKARWLGGIVMRGVKDVRRVVGAYRPVLGCLKGREVSDGIQQGGSRSLVILTLVKKVTRSIYGDASSVVAKGE